MKQCEGRGVIVIVRQGGLLSRFLAGATERVCERAAPEEFLKPYTARLGVPAGPHSLNGVKHGVNGAGSPGRHRVPRRPPIVCPWWGVGV